ncbi:MAG: L-idonate 5-dehydrogenase [Burkholderiaceae bacterium]
MTIRAARLHAAHDLRIDTLPPPAQPADDEVVVAIAAGGICGSDLHYFHDGGFGPIRVREPIVLGHEVAGTVRAAGAAVSHVRAGDLVAINPSQPCGACEYCRQRLFNQCLNMRFFGSAMTMPHVQGGFREAMLVKGAQCFVLPAGIDAGEAACCEPLSVALHAVNRVGGRLDGRSVLVMGSGPIGSLCVAAARHAGAAEIVATDLFDPPLRAAAAMGATQTLNLRARPDALEARAAAKGSFDVVFECTAAQAAIDTAVRVLRPRGTLVQVGVSGERQVALNMLVAREIHWIGTHRFHEEFAQAAELIGRRTIDVRPIITGSYPLDDCLAAFDAAGDRERAVKVQLRLAH